MAVASAASILLPRNDAMYAIVTGRKKASEIARVARVTAATARTYFTILLDWALMVVR